MVAAVIALSVLNGLLIIYLLILSRKQNATASNDEAPAWALQRIEELKSELANKQAELQAADEQLRALDANTRAEMSRLNAELTASKDRLAEQKVAFAEQKEAEKADKESMRNEFKVLADQILEEKSKQFKTTNTEQLDKLLSPFKEKLTDFERTVKSNHEKGLETTSALKSSLEALHKMNTQLSADAKGLANALRGDTKKQGNWGEFVLERALEMSGLSKDKEFFVQNSGTTEDGRRLQPDVVIQLPEGKKIIVDSKVSLVSWDAYVNAEDSDDSASQMKALTASIRTHIKGLSEKDYPQLYGGDTPEFVLLFIPIEAAFMEATKNDPDLYDFAFGKKIIVVSTSTLLATLKTIAMAWRQEKQTRNVIEIAEAGGKLYDKFVGLSEDLIKLGNQFKTAQNTYQDTMNKMTEGRGNLVSQVSRLKKLGSKTKKTIDNQLLERASEDEPSQELTDGAAN